MSLVLSIGATGSVGRHVVEVALERGHGVRALVRDVERARRILPAAVELVGGSLTSEADVARAAEGVEAAVLTHGTYTGDPAAVDLGALQHLLRALEGRRVPIALMTMIGVTDPGGYGGNFAIVAAKRRSERLLRVSGLPYTIVRPSWFGMAPPGHDHLVFLQGDTHVSGGPADGVIDRRQIARVLVDSLDSEEATGRTFELQAVRGEEQTDLDPLFAALDRDPPGGPDGAHDRP